MRVCVSVCMFSSSQEVAEPLQDLKEGMEQLEKNKTLRYILSTLLSIGNFLNGTNVSHDDCYRFTSSYWVIMTSFLCCLQWLVVTTVILMECESAMSIIYRLKITSHINYNLVRSDVP